MDVKELIEKEMKFAEYGCQVKIKAEIAEQDLLHLGAKQMGTTMHEDKYYAPKGDHAVENLVRIRKEGDEKMVFTFRRERKEGKLRNQVLVNKIIGETEQQEIAAQYDEVLTLHKRRTIYLLRDVVINLDRVDRLGSFIEFEVGVEKDYPKIATILRQLGLEETRLVRATYFELAMLNLRPIDRIMTGVHERFGRFAFGISSAVMTTLGLMIGLNSATSSRVAVIGGIVGIAVADSCSDSMGMYASKKSERGVSSSAALRSALSTFFGKFFFTLTFIIPYIFLPLGTAIYVCIAWGVLLLSFVNVQIAFVQEDPVLRTVLANIGIAVFVMLASYLAGLGVAAVLG